MISKKVLLILLTLVNSVALSQTKIQNLEKAFNNLLADDQAKHAVSSLCVLDANTGKILFAKNEEIGLATASTLKVITAATAFSVLG